MTDPKNIILSISEEQLGHYLLDFAMEQFFKANPNLGEERLKLFQEEFAFFLKTKEDESDGVDGS